MVNAGASKDVRWIVCLFSELSEFNLSYASVVAQMVKNLCNAGDPGSIPGLGKSPGRKVWQPTPFLPEKSHGQSSLVVCSPWGHKVWDITGQLTVSHPQILWAALSLNISKFMC